MKTRKYGLENNSQGQIFLKWFSEIAAGVRAGHTRRKPRGEKCEFTRREKGRIFGVEKGGGDRVDFGSGNRRENGGIRRGREGGSEGA